MSNRRYHQFRRWYRGLIQGYCPTYADLYLFEMADLEQRHSFF